MNEIKDLVNSNLDMIYNEINIQLNDDEEENDELKTEENS